jgi:hypothetical protein
MGSRVACFETLENDHIPLIVAVVSLIGHFAQDRAARIKSA